MTGRTIDQTVQRELTVAAWLLALLATILFYLSITGEGTGPAGIAALKHWIWVWAFLLVLVTGWVLVLGTWRVAARSTSPRANPQEGESADPFQGRSAR